MEDLIPDGWEKAPLTSLRRAIAISGESRSQLYNDIHQGKVRAVRWNGKTMLETKSFIAHIASGAPWKPNISRVAAAIAGRRDVRARQAAEAEQARETVERKVRKKAPTRTVRGHPASAARAAAKEHTR